MRTLELKNGLKVTMYTDIDELPIVNFQKYNKYLLIDSGIGSDIDAVDTHITAIAKYINSGDKENAIKELQNMRSNIYMINSNVSPKNMAFAALIHSINGKVVTDYSDDNLQAILKRLQGTKRSAIINFLMWIKKKLQDELETYFPADFKDVKEKEAYDKLKQRSLLMLDEFVNDTEHQSEIEAINLFLFNLHKPKLFIGAESVEVKYDKQFESACMLISQKANMVAKSMTVLEFYNTLSEIKRQAEAEAKAYKKAKR